MFSPRHQSELKRLRDVRSKPAPTLAIEAEMTRQATEFRRLQRGLGPLAAAWSEIVPPDLAGRTALVGVSRGVLTVRVEDSGVMHELARLLRSGAEDFLIRRSPVPLRRVKLTA